jgi:hypothetical protein
MKRFLESPDDIDSRIEELNEQYGDDLDRVYTAITEEYLDEAEDRYSAFDEKVVHNDIQVSVNELSCSDRLARLSPDTDRHCTGICAANTPIPSPSGIT